MMKYRCISIIVFLCVVQILFASSTISTINSSSKFYPVRERMVTKSLNGTWKIKVFRGLEMPSGLEHWTENSYDDTLWDDIQVPGNWETQGLKVPEYGVEVSEYTGLYRTTFGYDPAWKGKHVILRFDGVHFGYEIFVNGQKVGQWGSAYNLCQFDITRYLYSNKENTLCVRVITRSMGWKFDTNDCWGLVGITRDVELFTINNTYVEDITFVSDVNPNLDATVCLKVDINSFDYSKMGDLQLNVVLADPQNNHVLEYAQLLSKDRRTYNFEGFIARPFLWTAETPNLYNFEVCISDKEGNIIQRVDERVGIRNISVEGFDLKINHRPVLLHGVCLNEIDPKQGRALTYEVRRNQLQKMKEANINYIRTAHYPFGPDFLKLCDEMGFYVCEEVPFGSRGSEYLHDEKFIPELQARAEATISRDKNRPSIIIWSLGNENPYTSVVREVLKYVKKKDPTRPRGLPQKVGDFMKFVEKSDENVEILMGHYLSDTRIDQAVAKSQKPILHTEYAHAQGNAFGDFESKFARILKEDKVIGGSIWCWSDQAVLTNGEMKIGYSGQPDTLKRDARRYLPKEYQGVWIDADHFMDTFGDRGSDGIVYADGYPKENYYLVRKLYSPVTVSTSSLCGKLDAENTFTIEVENRFDFISLHGYKMKWQIKNLQMVLDNGSVWLETPARGKDKISLKCQFPKQLLFNDVMLCLEFIAPDGKRIHERNFPIELEGRDRNYLALARSEDMSGKLKMRTSKVMASSTTGGFSYTVSDQGVFSISGQGIKVIETPLLLRVGRAETNILKTQLLGKDKSFNWNPYLLKPAIERFDTQKKDGGVLATLFCRWNGDNAHSGQYVCGEVNIFFAPNGKVEFDYTLKPSDNATGNFLECGLTLDMGSSLNQFFWLGDGPYSSTPGKSAYNERDIWRLHCDDIRFNGNRKNVELGLITNSCWGVAMLSGNGNMGVENKDGKVFISQNVIVSGFGNKFGKPNELVAMKGLEVKGAFILFMTDLKESSSLVSQVFKSFPIVIPEKPYKKLYGW